MISKLNLKLILCILISLMWQVFRNSSNSNFNFNNLVSFVLKLLPKFKFKTRAKNFRLKNLFYFILFYFILFYFILFYFYHSKRLKIEFMTYYSNKLCQSEKQVIKSTLILTCHLTTSNEKVKDWCKGEFIISFIKT